MSLRFLHLADLHLGCKNYYLADRARTRTEEFRLAFRDAVEFALDRSNDIDGVLIAGNLFEHHRPEEELWSFTKGLISRLLAKDILVAMVPGNHDSFAYKNSVYRTERLPGVELFLNTAPEAPRVFERKGRRVFLYGLAFVPGQTPRPLPAFPRAAEKGIHVALLHGRPAQDGIDAEKPHELELDLRALAENGFDYVALGGRRSFQEERLGDSMLVYPGSLEGRGFADGEYGDKGPVVVEFDDAGGVHVERLVRNRKSIEHVRLDLRAERITDAAALENALATLGGKDRIVRVTLTGTAEFVASLDEIQEKLAESFWHLEIVDESRLVDSALLGKIESENTIRGYFVRKMAARIAALKQKIDRQGQTAESMRELLVHEKALKMGVEQFVEEEVPADSIYSLIPDSDETVEAESIKKSVGVADLEERVKAMLEYRRKLNREGEAAEAAEAAVPAEGSEA
ncbi:MAG: metallophosphoesterase [Planctomycetes bacterium]|nr:metallophosphoesterase [Planctomycetota bacterium]